MAWQQQHQERLFGILLVSGCGVLLAISGIVTLMSMNHGAHLVVLIKLGLASFALSLPLGIHIFANPPDPVLKALHDDYSGVTWSRLTSL